MTKNFKLNIDELFAIYRKPGYLGVLIALALTLATSLIQLESNPQWRAIYYGIALVFVFTVVFRIIYGFITPQEQKWIDLINFTKKESDKISYVDKKLRNRVNKLRSSFPSDSLLEDVKTNYTDNNVKGIKDSTLKLQEAYEDLEMKSIRLQEVKKLFEITGKNMQLNKFVLEEMLLGDIAFDTIPKFAEDMNYYLQDAINTINISDRSSNEIDNILKSIKDLRKEFNHQYGLLLETLDKRKELIQDSELFAAIININKQPSTGKAVISLSKILQVLLSHEKENEDIISQLRVVLELINSRMGFSLSELLGLKIEENNEIRWYGKKLDDKNTFEEMRRYFRKFEELRHMALNDIWDNNKDFFLERISKDENIAIALTYGYSAVLKKILEEIIIDRKSVHLILIKGRGSLGDEETIYRDLKSFVDSRSEKLKFKCTILPLNTLLEERIDILEKVNYVFMGIESINTEGYVVHPRGGVKTILELKDRLKDIDKKIITVAFGESYKVKNFHSFNDVEHNKLLVMPPIFIDFVVTDDGVHYKVQDGWKKYKLPVVPDISCCEDYWKKRVLDELNIKL